MDFKPLGQPTPLSAALPKAGPSKPAPVTGPVPPTLPQAATQTDQIHQGAVPPGQAVGSLAFVEDVAAVDPPTREELQWSLELEAKMKQGFQPTAADALRFNEIEMRLAATLEPQELGPPTRAEVNWALGLEDKVKQGYQPNASEIKQYQNIAHRLFKADQTPSVPELKTVTREELAWAKDLETKITHAPPELRYEATKEDIEKYQDIYNRYQAEKAEQKKQVPPTPEELKWAQDLADEITQKGHKATPEEVERYTEIFQRHQAASNPDSTQSLSSDDLKWHMQLTAKMEQGYQPTAAELDRAGKIVEALYLNDSNLIQPHDSPVAQHEQDWALRLKAQAEQGIPPSPEELERYAEIYNRYAALPQK
ncbi:MAG: hypothetical protein AB7I41_23185 [Candidatus Sericytochromatia bacterium]